ncbi:MAG TPA: C39 family peptidase [Chitinophagaceae bacterium]|nr:C39 family peptidase [Chitinophagaceae bacterium]
MKKTAFYIIVLLWLTTGSLVSCKKTDLPTPTPPSGNSKSTAAEIESYSIAGMDAPTSIISTNATVTARFPDSLKSGADIVADFTLSKGATATVAGVKQVSGQSKNNYEGDIEFLVTAGDGVTKKYWHISGTNNNYSVPWGLGHFVKQSVSNNRDYEWYMGQSSTGSYSTINCGPTSVTMAIKWYDSTFAKNPLDARNSTQTDGGLWYPSTVNFYLQKYNVPFIPVTLGNTIETGTSDLKQQMDKGRIMVLLITSSALRIAIADTLRVDRYYSWENGHFIVVKGYKEVDNETFFEVYDPWDYERYPNGQGSMGKDRYYRAEDLITASWYNNGSGWAIPPPK